MKLKNLFILFIISLLANNAIAQTTLPAKAEDISPLLIGENVPNENLTNVKGETVSLTNLVKEKPTVLIFYRGGWCPYCSKHLAQLAEIEADVIKAGYQIVAISPDDAKHLAETDDKNKINYQLFSDSKGSLAKAFGVAFQAPTNYEKYLKDASGDVNATFLPVPAVFVVNTKGEIVFEYISPNFKQRLEGKLLVAVLQNLAK